jgi:hypothetical protein
MNVIFKLLGELIEIVPAGFDIGNEFFVVDDPISVYQAVAKIKERLQLLEKSFRNNSFLATFCDRIDIATIRYPAYFIIFFTGIIMKKIPEYQHVKMSL